MSNNVENCPAKKFIKLCFADDSGKYKDKDKYRFWENFAKPELRIDVWEDGCPKIYNYAKSYDALPDPDVNSYNLYEAHIRVWNKQCENFKEIFNIEIPEIERNGRCRCELKLKNKNTVLGSDSIMSIYWHRTFGNMRYLMKEICKDEKNKLKSEIDKLKKRLNLIDEKDVDRHFNDNFSLYKKFIWDYLQYANTIGGFMLFPRHDCSINQARGMSDRIQDRFDLTLECIRRMYENGFFTNTNPLFGISKEDKEFFEMFGSFENYAKFFCLNESWVEKGKVLNLLYDDENKDKSGRNVKTLDEWDFSQEPLPRDSDEWWTFYRNIMDRLKERNDLIKMSI